MHPGILAHLSWLHVQKNSADSAVSTQSVGWSWTAGGSSGEKTSFSAAAEEDLFIGQALWQAASLFWSSLLTSAAPLMVIAES